MNKKPFYFPLLFLISSTAIAASQSQSDWSGGATTEITNAWGAKFSNSANMAWQSRSGRISLASILTGKKDQTIIAGDAQRPYGIAVGDITGDGYDEVLTTHPVISSVPINDPASQGAIYYWQLKQTDNNWVRRTITEDFYGVQSVDLVDFDGDGDLDVIAVASYGVTNPPAPAVSTRNGRYAWFENVNGDGSNWAKHEVGSLFWGANSVAAADIDGDGDMDLMGTSALTTGGLYQQASDVTWFENSDGKGSSWIQHDIDDLGDQLPTDARVADIDGDGDIDFIVARWNEVFIYENSGDGSQFTRRVLTNKIYSNPAVEIGDMDHDGDIDVIVSAPRDDRMYWLENVNGDGSLWQEHLILYLYNVHRQEAVDIDGDGDLDLLISYWVDSDSRFGHSYIYENISGDGKSWAYHDVKDFLNDHTYSRAGDLNHDGRLDVVVMEQDNSRSNAEQLSWFDVGEFTANATLTSQILDGGVNPNWDVFGWKASVPSSTLLTVSVRAGSDASNLGPFLPVAGSGTNVASLIDGSARYFQYKVEMSSSDVNQSPILTDIGFNLSPDSPPPPAPNQAPVANSGNGYTYFPKQTATLDGSRSYDYDGQIVAYQWRQLSGSKVNLVNANQAVVTFTTPRVKRNSSISLEFELTVTDDAGATGTDTVIITVRN